MVLRAKKLFDLFDERGFGCKRRAGDDECLVSVSMKVNPVEGIGIRFMMWIERTFEFSLGRHSIRWSFTTDGP